MATAEARQRSANRLTFICMASSGAVLALLVFGESGSSDAGIVFGYTALLVGLFIACPLHVIVGPFALYNAWQTGRRRVNSWIFGYFALWTAAVVGALIAGGALEPVTGAIAKFVYEQRNPAESKLYKLIRHGTPIDHEALARAISEGANVNGRDQYNNWPFLVHVVRKGDPTATRMLLDAGADPNVVRDRQYGFGGRYGAEIEAASILTIAAFNERGARVATLQALLDGGATPDGGAVLGACLRSDTAAFDLLVKAGAPLDSTDLKMQTCLHFAAGEGADEIIARLLARGVDVNARNRFAQTPLDLAVKYKKLPTIRTLLGAGGSAKKPGKLLLLAVEDPDAYSAIAGAPGLDVEIGAGEAFWEVLYNCRSDSLQRLLALGVSPDTSGERGPPLHILARSSCANRAQLLQILLDAGADLEARFRGKTPVAAAAEAKSADYLRLLLDAGADIEAKVTREGVDPTPADPSILESMAVYFRFADASILLIRAGAKLTPETRERLARTAKYQRVEHLQRFLEEWPQEGNK